MPLLEINNLQVRYPLARGKWVMAVEDVSLTVAPGESVGLVGESGCGKSSLGKAVVRLVPAHSGSIIYEGQAVSELRGTSLKRFRRQVQMVFQDPLGSLNPRMSIGAALEEVLIVHHYGNKTARRHRLAELLQITGLEADYARRYPHELSGGQRQRVGIARALALQPGLIVADEPVSALDVSVQAQILSLMRDLQHSTGLAWLFIAHDLAVVNYMCQRVYVMYHGLIMETGNAQEVFSRTIHPYTELLLAVIPSVDNIKMEKRASKNLLKGETPEPLAFIKGCPFHPRCVYASGICREELPALQNVADNHACRCHFARERNRKAEPGNRTGN